MDTWHLHQGTRMQNMKKLTSDVHLNSKKCHWCGPNKSYDLFTHFIGNLLIVGDYLIRNNIFPDKSYALSIYLFKFYWSNHSKS